MVRRVGVVLLAEEPPPARFARWTGPLLAVALADVSED